MAKRRFKNKKVRYVAIGTAITSGAAVAIVLLPSANAAPESRTTVSGPEEIMRMCERSKVLEGKPQHISDFGGSGIAGPGFEADSCEFVETKFETFNGPTEKVTIDFPNCPPDLNPEAVADGSWTTSVAQGEGKYKVTQQGAVGGLFGALSGAWVKHKGTLDMTIRTATASETINRPIPEGKELFVEFTPKMQRMTGKWVVKIDAKPATTVLNPVPEQIFEAEEVVEGPVILPGAAGAPGAADGLIETKLKDCGSR
ncbi:hypothetical protein WBG99_20325 [Streptomyces sp. TG1A-60]|uniref:hypothetical protein n=1 Tax=Streptomyces sp. TG1A-60 TaxID=3129111 RepID=UPI0030D19602